MPLTIATWNINSVRLRIDTVARFAETYRPDVLCLQETKCQDGQFPLADIRKMGFNHVAVHGQKGYHGVAVLSRFALGDIERKAFCGKNDARHVAVTLADGPAAGTRIHNFYVPAGGDEPDPAINDKFAHKLGFLDEMEGWDALRVGAGTSRTVLVGDLNIAPLEHDVWSSRQLRNVVSHTPIERRRLTEVATTGGWVDMMRTLTPEPEKLYTWWSYRSADWVAANKGRRLDHVWLSPALGQAMRGFEIVRDARGWTRPSDHVPVIATLDL
ncbi:exodeoxyribonuclease III [Phreatobacter sp. AB_2022a]|uniref:exodeoxyribonuclease III n=1 Tax=Phreatobacter sp. AB_2022a TaxID=3003134 RepID=UPI002286EB34|nr:exodeoxyribonuclease III [Phreatobacter sp. AB_2022a]MCZ0737270.1 exodeoxyribonuclease III [Phreatobacter sp. AB_2022a]